MRVYGYVRLSRDEDNRTKESLEVQQRLVRTYAKENNLELIDLFVDDNVSGYKFDRPALNQLKTLIEDENVDILLAKDLSRIGRHNAKTLMFLDYLEEYNVRLVLINDDYDSEKDDDDIIGIKTWYNERYIKDISKKIKANIKQRQKDEGLVIIPPYGYLKNEDGTIVVDEEAKLVIKHIYRMYLDGFGMKAIAKKLNEIGYKTPMQRKQEFYKNFGNQGYTTSHLWYHTTVNRILKNEAYIGTLICAKTKRDKVKGKKKYTTQDEQIIHENYFPEIISKNDFDMVQQIMKTRVFNNVRAKNTKIYNYAGLLKCADCNNSFTVRKYKTKTMGIRKKYVCTTNHKFGNEYCTSHGLFEENIDKIVYSMIEDIKNNAEKLLESIDETIKKKRKNLNANHKTIEKIKSNIYKTKEVIKNYSKQLAKGLISEEIFKELVTESNNQLSIFETQLKEVNDLMKDESKLKVESIRAIDICNEILDKKDLNNSQLSLLIKQITVGEDENGERTIVVEPTIPIKNNYTEVLSSCDSVTLWLTIFTKVINDIYSVY